MLLIQRSFFFFSKSESSDHSIIIIPSELISMPGNELSWVNWRSSFTWKNVLHLLCHFFFSLFLTFSLFFHFSSVIKVISSLLLHVFLTNPMRSIIWTRFHSSPILPSSFRFRFSFFIFRLLITFSNDEIICCQGNQNVHLAEYFQKNVHFIADCLGGCGEINDTVNLGRCCRRSLRSGPWCFSHNPA